MDKKKLHHLTKKEHYPHLKSNKVDRFLEKYLEKKENKAPTVKIVDQSENKDRQNSIQKDPNSKEDLLNLIRQREERSSEIKVPEQPQSNKGPVNIPIETKQIPEVKHELKQPPADQNPVKQEHPKAEIKSPQQLLEKYSIEVDGARVEVEIKRSLMGIFYYLNIPKIDLPTEALLNEIRNELIIQSTISMKELTDEEALHPIKMRFMDEATQLLRTKLPKIVPETERFLVGRLMQNMLGLGDIEFLVEDSNLEEIVIPSAKEPIRVFSKKYGWLITNITIKR